MPSLPVDFDLKSSSHMKAHGPNTVLASYAAGCPQKSQAGILATFASFISVLSSVVVSL
jgi:hypothetical protein